MSALAGAPVADKVATPVVGGALIGNSAAVPDGGASGSKHRADLALERGDVRGEDVPGSIGVPG